MSLEGELRVGLRLADGHIDRVSVTSTRPDVALALLQGRSRADVQAAVPRLFAICGRSQQAASTLACAAADGAPILAGQLDECRLAVRAETVRESALQLLLHWPRWIDEEPAPQAIAAARGAATYRASSHDDALAQSIALAAFGAPAREWLSLQTWPEFGRWAATGGTASARFVRRLQPDDDVAGGTAEPPLLPAPSATWLAELAARIEGDATFTHLPVWRGAPAQTGALARLQDDALIANAQDRPASPTLLRFVARLRELALLLAGHVHPAVGAVPLGPGRGLAWVQNARGLLVHQASLDGETVRRYRIVAPTEWNFHPQGVLACALEGASVASLDVAQRLAGRLIHSLDPCVACRVELDDA